ncbi:MAG: hypothetical protein KDB37_06455 [Ilumatobacter sp.]|nr:hypothetical protein [Ilumatobacter sp.]
MQPAHSGDGGSSTNLKKWGPIAAIVLVVGAVVGIVFATGGGDDDDVATDTTVVSDDTATDDTATDDTATDDTTAPDATEPDETTAPETTDPAETTDPDTTDAPAGGDITYPLSFTAAQEQGIDVEWGERCDTDLGTLAVKWYFAPSCYAPFEGDNGGETATGVTADSIKVVQYLGPDNDPIISYLTDAIAVDDSNDEAEATLRSMLDMFSSYYEFYGRTIEYETYVSSGIANDEVTARADAVRIAEDFQPFAVLGGPALTSAFADELAARGIVCIGCTPGQPQAWYAERSPYVYGLAIGAAQAREHGREFIAKQLIGGNAEYAGDEAFQGQPRTFGHVYLSSSPESPELADAFVSGLTADGADVVEVLPYTLDPATIQQQASQIVAKLKSSGVTTVVIASDGVAPRDITREATAQEYFPEWVLVAPALSDLTAFGRTYDQEQWAHAFGVTHGAVPVTPEESGYYALYRWWTGEEPPAADTIGVLIPNMALLVSGIQQTGPDLTPDNMAAALFNGPTTRPGITQPFLSYGDRGYWEGDDFSGVDDAALIWWDPNAQGPDEIRKDGTGMYVFVDGGTRYLPGEWPADSALFDPAGGTTIYDTPPPEETPPDYPSPAG